MSIIYTRQVVGVDPTDADGGLNLVALSQRFRRLTVLGALQLPDAAAEAAPSKVSAFLARHGVQGARVVACLPRESVLVRFMDLPAEAEKRLAQVVGYQIDSLHPFAEDQVHWDCTVISRQADGKQVRVLVVIAEKSRLRSYCDLLRRVGLKVGSLTLSAACLGALIKDRIPAVALVACVRGQGLELAGFSQGSLCATREVPIQPKDGAAERFDRELHSVRSVLDPGESAELPLFICGEAPGAFAEVLTGATALPRPGPRLTQSADFDLGKYFTALAAAYAGIPHPGAAAVNLLPVEERWQPTRGLRGPAYALGVAAALLGAMVLGHGWIENIRYARALDREIARLEPRAAGVRRESQEASVLVTRAARLEDLRDETWRKLEILRELTHLLPDGTWVDEVQLGEGTVEVFGQSAHAADLVQPLENSRYFTQVEFTSPITRNGQDKEVFRMRMRLRAPQGL